MDGLEGTKNIALATEVMPLQIKQRGPLTYVPSQGLQCLVKIVVPKTIDCDTDSV